MNPISIITCVVGVIGCVVGVSTFVSAQITKAKQDGVLIEKVDQCVKGIDDIKKDMKEKNYEFDKIIDEHSNAIIKLQTEMATVWKHLKLGE